MVLDMTDVNEIKQEMIWKFKGKQIMWKYPQMGKRENVIWSYFLTYIPWDDIEEIWYAVRVGPPYVPVDELEDPLKRVFVAATTLRIDAVVWRKAEVWIMEVKEVGNVVAIGQLVSYQHYFLQEYPVKKPVYLGLVCEDYKKSIEPVAKRYGITIFKVKPWGIEIV